MKKYLSVVILIILCVVCAMIFYANAANFSAPAPIETNSQANNSQNPDDTSVNQTPTEDVKPVSIEREGTFLSEYLTDTSLRIEWAIFKHVGDSTLYLSCELFLDSPYQINDEISGYLSINGEKTEFDDLKVIGSSYLLCSATKTFDYSDKMIINIDGYAETSISNSSGVRLDGLTAKGTVIADEGFKNLPSSYLIDLKHISQYPDLPSGDEITSLAMVLNYLGYNADKCELCDLYLDKGPVGFTDFNIANVGNPRNAYNSYGCLAPVIVKAAKRYIQVNGGSYNTYDISGYCIDGLLSEVASGNPVIVWACEDFDITPSISRIWVVDGKTLYLKSNMATMVLVGYDLINNTVTLSNPAGVTFEIDMELFSLRFCQMGANAVVIK